MVLHVSDFPQVRIGRLVSRWLISLRIKGPLGLVNQRSRTLSNMRYRLYVLKLNKLLHSFAFLHFLLILLDLSEFFLCCGQSVLGKVHIGIVIQFLKHLPSFWILSIDLVDLIVDVFQHVFYLLLIVLVVGGDIHLTLLRLLLSNL